MRLLSWLGRLRSGRAVAEAEPERLSGTFRGLVGHSLPVREGPPTAGRRPQARQSDCPAARGQVSRNSPGLRHSHGSRNRSRPPQNSTPG